jgi:serine/threonine protein phosphatase PrpC
LEVYEQQLKIGNKKIRSVGTCGITAIVHNDKVYVGNSGDSMGMFIMSEGNGLMKTEKTN